MESQIDLPVVNQKGDYDCGAAALRAVCKHFGKGPDSQADFIKVCGSDPDHGTTPDDIVRAARNFGLNAEKHVGMSVEDLKGHLDADRPVICAIQAWDTTDGPDYSDNDSGHYLVASGHCDGQVYFQDPYMKTDARGRLPEREFESRWHDTDKSGKLLKRLGIVVWDESGPEETRRITRSKKIV